MDQDELILHQQFENMLISRLHKSDDPFERILRYITSGPRSDEEEEHPFYRTLAARYIGLALSRPQLNLFRPANRSPAPALSPDSTPANELAVCLIRHIKEGDLGVPELSFLLSEASRAHRRSISAALFSELCAILRSFTLLQDPQEAAPVWSWATQAYLTLLSVPQVLDALPDLECFVPAGTARAMENLSYLGCFLHMGSFPSSIPMLQQMAQSLKLNLAPTDLQWHAAAPAQHAMRFIHARLQLLHAQVHSIFSKLCAPATPKRTRDATRKWVGCVLNTNITRLQTIRSLPLSSPAMLLNLNALLVDLMGPVVARGDAAFSGIDAAGVLFNSDHLNLGLETRNGATSPVLAEQRLLYLKTRPPQLQSADAAEQTELLLMAIRAFHICWFPSVESLKQTIRAYADRAQVLQNSSGLPRIRQHALQGELLQLSLNRFFFKSQIFEPQFLRKAIHFWLFVARWLRHELDHSPFVNTYPEFFIASLGHFFEAVLTHEPDHPDLLNRDNCLVVLETLIAYLARTDVLHNPHLRASLVQSISHFISTGFQPARIFSRELFDRAELKLLLPALFQFFIDIEFTGRSSQFLDKFESRHYVARIMTYVWMMPVHRQQMELVSTTYLFRCFLDRWLNDTIYLLDEAFAQIIAIKVLQDQLAAPDPTNETRTSLLEAERRVRPFLALANENLTLMAEMTRGIPAPFQLPEFVSRVACMLNLYSDQLAGHQCGKMSLQNGRSLGFNPKKLLTQITQIYLNLDNPQFCAAVADDERSYSREVLERVKNILSRFDLVPEAQIEKFSSFTHSVHQIAIKNKSRSQLLQSSEEGVPDEFFDPIMNSMMIDPVTLPSSRVTVDRAVITRHLLSNPCDPFNRTPLSEEDLIPNTELKQRIQDFLAKSADSEQTAQDLDSSSPNSSYHVDQCPFSDGGSSDTSPTSSGVLDSLFDTSFSSSSGDSALPPHLATDPSNNDSSNFPPIYSSSNPSSYVETNDY